MTLLLLGLILWIGAHFFKRLMPEKRAAMGDKGRGPVALAILVGLILMIVGFRMSDFIPVYDPPSWGVHLNNLLMLISIVLFGMANTTGRLRGRMRHPMLAGVRAWAVAHLLVNGDLASIILFGGMFLWAMAEVVLINRAEPDWQRPEPGGLRGDIILAVVTVVLFVAIAAVHFWLGYPVFPG